MTRPATIKQDDRIISLYASGISPKNIVIKLNLSSIYVVYEAIRRERRKIDRATGLPITKIHQDSPRPKIANSM